MTTTINTLRFIATAAQAERLRDHLVAGGRQQHSVRGLEVELTSLRAFRDLCNEHGVQFEVLALGEFIEQNPRYGVSLILDAEVEDVVYHRFWRPPLHVDGRGVAAIIRDKYSVYRVVGEAPTIRQPKTLPIHNHRDLERARDALTTRKIVIKPRYSGHSSRNVLIVDRSRIEDIRDDECLNFSDCIVQEYLADAPWPPVEWRAHFVGRDLCRWLEISDKNNWRGKFGIRNLAVDDVLPELRRLAAMVAHLLVSQHSRDNFTVDFLAGADGPIFLEANCGALGSFYISGAEEIKFLEPIVMAIFRRHFKRRSRTVAIT